MSPEYRPDYSSEDYGFFEFEILGHVFAIATSKIWNITFDLYIKKGLELKKEFFSGYRVVKQFNDVDLTLNRAFDDDRDRRLFNG